MKERPGKNDWITNLIKSKWARPGEKTWSAFAFIFLLLVFFSTPLLTGGYYSSADSLQVDPLLNVGAANYAPKDLPLFDPVVQFQPWYKFNWQELSSGRLPLWNPYNGAGVPHFANYQSAVLSVFTLPFYVLDFRAALVVSAFMKLFGLGFFTFLFLRRLGLHPLAAFGGGVAFMFTGHNIVFLGTLNPAALVVLPASLYFTELIFQQATALKPKQRASGWPWLGLIGSILVGLLAGHPESFFFSMVLVGLYFLQRWLTAPGLNWRERGWLLGRWVAALGAGAGLAALQLIPFLEYTLNSTALAGRQARQTISVIPPVLLPLHFFPNLAGNPVGPYHPTLTDQVLRQLSFQEINAIYIGMLVLFGALLSLPLALAARFHLRTHLFFAVFGLIGAAYFYNLLNLAEFLRILPGFHQVEFVRSEMVVQFALAVCFAFTLHFVMTGIAWTRWRLMLVVAVGLGWLGLGLVSARYLVQVLQLDTASSDFKNYVPGSLLYIGLTYLLGLAGLVALGRGDKWPFSLIKPRFRHRLRLGLAGLVVGTIFMQSGFLFKEHNPTIEDRFFFPETPAVAAFKKVVGQEYSFFEKGGSFPFSVGNPVVANANVWYDFTSRFNYDALGVGRYDNLAGLLLSSTQEKSPTDPRRRFALELFGMRYVALNNYNLPLKVGQQQDKTDAHVGQILPGQSVSQKFTGEQSQLSEIDLRLATFGRLNHCTLNFALYPDALNTTPLTRQKLDCTLIGDDQYVAFAFPPQSDSANKAYRLELTSDDATPGNAVTVLSLKNPRRSLGELTAGEQTLNQNLNLRVWYGQLPNLRLAWQGPAINLYKIEDSPGRFWLVNQAGLNYVPDESQAFQFLATHTFEVNQQTVVVDSARPTTIPTMPTTDPANSSGPVKLTLTGEHPGYYHFEATNSSSSSQSVYLATAISYYPGWKVRVNGQEVVVQQTNYAFVGASLPVLSGGQSVSIELSYEPFSWQLGLIVSATTLLLLILSFGIPYFLRFRRQRGALNNA